MQGLRSRTFVEFVGQTGCEQVHLTAFAEQQDSSTLANAKIFFGAANGPAESKYERTDREYVRRMKEELIGVD